MRSRSRVVKGLVRCGKNAGSEVGTCEIRSPRGKLQCIYLAKYEMVLMTCKERKQNYSYASEPYFGNP